ncbi:MAG TPA: hypothetical protein VNX67_02410 [Solirubrobacteraceae bacterium]|jgi:hypothetical protein|nr:hypothetical protein [Solirubrobacteraceae bacterium]
MSCRPILALACALALAPAASAPAGATAQSTSTSTSESASPIADQGSSFHYRSEITSITPDVKDLNVEVLEFADRLVLTNHTGKTVTVYGYSGEPYARVQPNGTTEQNTRSPAVYLNTNFYGNVTVPSSASASLPPAWVVVDRTGTFEWHDHRIHWMSPVTPPQVKDESKRTLIFHWSVPISVGAQKGVVAGQLFWVPDSSKAPIAAIVALVVIVLLALGFIVWVRRRRARSDGPQASENDSVGNSGEAW